jgi:putative pyruvate formate lyase activating enzyme
VKADALPLWPQRPEGACYAGAFNAPMLWNSNFFMSEPALRILRVLMDVWLPDLKFGPGPCAVALARTPWYWETVTGNLKAVRDWGEDLTIRHLVMPGHVECCTRPVLEWIAATMPEVPVNVMDQYHPDNFCDPCSPKFDPKYRALARRPMREEVLQAFRYARGLGLRFQALSYEKNTTGLRV